MAQQIKAVRFDVEEIGKHVKGSKKRFTWIFTLNKKNHTIVVDFSFISGKVKVVVDRKTILQNQLPTSSSFQHPFTLQGYALNILQQGQTFELRINNKVFSHLYNQAKTNTEFKNYEDQIKDIQVDQSSFQGGKKITLNIGGMTKKKNYKSSTQSEDWGNFGGSQMGFASYFGENTSTSSSSTQKKEESPKKSNLLDDDEEEEKQPSQKQDFVDFSKQVSQKPQIRKTQEIDFFAESNQETSYSPSQQQMKQMMKKKENMSSNVQPDDFNTMQNLFATMNTGGTVPQKKQSSSLDFFNQQPQYVQPQVHVPQNPARQTANINDFNTMQQLFATSNPSNFQPSTSNMPTSINTEQKQNINQFNTIAYGQNLGYQQTNMYNTSVPNAGKKQMNPFDLLDSHIDKFKNSSAKQNLTASQQPKKDQINMEDFNTMQNLFKTQTPQNFGPPSNVSNLSTNNNSADDFSTMQNLFKTQNNVSMGASNTNNQQQMRNTQQFNTMQNLFNTQNNQGGALDLFAEEPVQKPATTAFSKKSQPMEEDLI